MESSNPLLDKFYAHLREGYHLGSISGLLSWDQQVNMPVKGAEDRSAQIELIDRLSHQRVTDPQFIDLVERLSDMRERLSADDKVNVLETKRSIDRQRKLPVEFVSERSAVTSLSYVEWTQARPRNDFAGIKPYLSKIIDLCRREAELVGYEEHPYNALLDVYEPHAKISSVKPLLSAVAEELRLLIPKIQKKIGTVPKFTQKFDLDKQHALCLKLLKDIGFPLDRGRLDRAPHPFQTKLGWHDLRITTRYDENDFLSAISSTMHELGHAFYEMNLSEKHKGTPLAQAVSLGIHESQSRLWENIVGRSRPYSQYLYKIACQHFPELAKTSSSEDLWLQNNMVLPSLIRVDADEVTYSMHIVIRMLLEEDLISGALSVDDLPEAWNSLYEKYLGIRPPDYKDGVMQDVHWYSGAFGYFPTYALGNLYGAMFMDKAALDIPNLYAGCADGSFNELLAWLRTNIHEQGMRYPAEELVKVVTGKPLAAESFLNYLRSKFNV